MKRVIAAVGALALISGVAANAALTTYDFNNARIGTITIGSGDTSFDAGLTSLGITSSNVTGNSAGTGGSAPGVIDVIANCSGCTIPTGSTNFAKIGPGANPNTGATQAYAFSTGNGGTWTLVFGGGGTSGFSFDFWDTNLTNTCCSNGSGSTSNLGFVATAYDITGTTIIGQVTVNGTSGGSGSATVTGTGTAPTYFTTPTNNQSGTAGFTGIIGKVTIQDLGNDTTWVDDLSATPQSLVATPEPSTYFMIGSALAGFATFRRRRRA